MLLKRFINFVKSIFSTEETQVASFTESKHIKTDTSDIKKKMELLQKKNLCLQLTDNVKLFAKCHSEMCALIDELKREENISPPDFNNIIKLDEILNIHSNKADDICDKDTLYAVIFCMRDKEYYYLGGDKSYTEGQYVKVPSDSGDEKIGKVKRKIAMPCDGLHIPVENLKKITGNAI